MQEYVNSSGQAVKEELFRNDRVKSRTVFLNEQRTEYILTNYYESGVLEDSAYYRDGVINGMRIYFNQEEGLLYEEHYSGGLLNGIQRAAYANGISSFEGFRKNGRMAGQWLFHYPDGNPITYEFYDSAGVLKYFKKYSEEGTSEDTKGSGIISLPVLPDTISAGSTAELVLLVAVPPHYEARLSVKISEPEGNAVVHSDQEVTEETLVLPYSFEKPGTYTFYFDLTIQSTGGSASENYKAEQSFTIQ